MTATTAVLLPVQKKRVRNAILNALGRHGVSTQTAEAIWFDLTTGNDPRPANLPEQFHYRGIKIDWPIGRGLRLVRKDEMRSLNAALAAAGIRKGEMLDADDNAESARAAYTFLWAHKSGVASVRHKPYNPEPVRAAKLRELIEEATEAREIANAPVLVDAPEPVWDESVPLLTGAGGTCKTFVCESVSPKGKACTLVGAHDGQHSNGSTRWGKRDRTHADTPVVIDSEATLQGAIDELVADMDALDQASACGMAGPFDGVACERETHDDDEHHGSGYAWTGVSERVSVSEPVVEVTGCPFDLAECRAMQDAGEGECDEHPQPTREEIIAAAKERTSVQIVTTPERVTTAQAVPLEATTDVDALLAELRALSTRLEAK